MDCTKYGKIYWLTITYMDQTKIYEIANNAGVKTIFVVAEE